ncbi:Helix-loop-helix protein delilah [Eumeta japonica]|uniref:Helix-loop-helix protein delilah n=1 Tax=Eumeta variegata TaxID=151549 RepID=A0A4C1WII9_EUMVA|nr:Helix-loop-helix protein delilah [Eumeta japonica]
MPEHDKYQLRPRAGAAAVREPRARRHVQPLSKYRRKTANARERSRMREINRAFETLRRAVPAAPAPSEKLTKITTLRLAMRYIAALSAALRDHTPVHNSPPRSDLSDLSVDLDLDLDSGLRSDADFNSDLAEDSLSPFDSFFAEFECEYTDRTFA